MRIRDILSITSQALLLLVLLFGGIWFLFLMEEPVDRLRKEMSNATTDLIEFRERLQPREEPR